MDHGNPVVSVQRWPAYELGIESKSHGFRDYAYSRGDGPDTEHNDLFNCEDSNGDMSYSGVVFRIANSVRFTGLTLANFAE